MIQASQQIARQYTEAGLNKKNWGSVAYNVLVEGLVGDGVADDTAALQALINTAIAAGRKAINFPHTSTGGQYYVTSLTNADQVVFFGDNASFVGGYTGTIIQLGEGGVTPDEFAALEAEYATHIATEATEEELGHVKRKYKAPVQLSRLPKNANGTYGWNGVAFIQDNITTYNGKQYTVFVDASQKPYIAKRTLPNGKWTTFDLSTITDNPLASPTANDGHNVYSLMVDNDGYIHISGNLHNAPLRYARSVNPEDISSWAAATMTGANEDLVSYPQFVKMRDGKLLFFYRNGSSGSGDTFINAYNTTTKAWSKVQAKFIDGLTSSESPYLNHIAVDLNNTIHLMYVWRGSGLANTNNDICYAKSEDGGVTWKKANGTTYTLPITHATSEVVVDTSATDSGLLNQNGLEVDNQSRPHGAFLLYDGNGYTQINHVWHDGTIWHTDVVTDFTYKYVTAVTIPNLSVSRPSVFTTENGRAYIIYRHRNNGHRDTIRLIDVTPGVTYYNDFPILHLDLGDWEPTFDTQSLYERNELHMLICPLKNNGSASTEWNEADNWTSQYLATISYDLDQIDVIQRRETELPAIQTVSNMIVALTTPLSITATTRTDLAIPGMLYRASYQGTLFVKLKARANLVSGATKMNITLKELNETAVTGATYYYGSIAVTGTGGHYETAWIPIQAVVNGYGFFIAAGVIDAGSGRATLLEIELGILDFL